MKIFHNIQEDETIKDMTGSMSGICAAKDNKQAEYQSPMIEVEGRIYIHPISILIDY